MAMHFHMDPLALLFCANICFEYNLKNILIIPDGSISETEQKIMKGIGTWMDTNGEAIFETRKWRTHGSGAAKIVQVKFDKGAVGSPHHHFHTQTTYVAEGKFEFTIDGEKKIVEAGDGVYIEPNLVHGAECLEAGMLIDVFSPIREDFVDGSGVSYFGDKD